MNIANPIYDSVFKQLMSNIHIARFFIETILEETILDVAVHQQEITYDKNGNRIGKTPLALYRLDFIATIKTKSGEHKKVLIEIQKTRKYVDLVRFRNYLGEQYKREEEVITEDGKKTMPLHIIAIYLLGFELEKIPSQAIRVNREYVDMVTHKVINTKDDFVEKLTHDCYIVQIPRIEGKLQTKLETLLTIFEQKNFVDEYEDIKEYNYPIEDENIKQMVEMLHFACIDPESKKTIAAEREAFRVFNLALDEEMRKAEKKMREQEKIIKENEIELEKQGKELEEKSKELEGKGKELEEKGKELEEKDKELEEKDTALEAMAKKIAELEQMLKK